MKTKLLTIFILLLILALLLCACKNEDTGGDNTPPPAPPIDTDGGQNTPTTPTTPTTPNVPSEPTDPNMQHYRKCFTVDGATITGLSEYGLLHCAELVIPTTIEGITITAIAPEAFKDCSSIKSLTIPQTVTSIGKDAFLGCSELIKKEDKILYVSGWIIGCDEGLSTNITLSENTVGIAAGAFDGISITAITAKEGLQSISAAAFAGCQTLTTVKLANSTRVIAKNAFANCTALASVSFGSGLEAIGDSAFEGCFALRDLSFPASLTAIGARAFADCSGLFRVARRARIENYKEQEPLRCTIGAEAFRGCEMLITVEGIEIGSPTGDNTFADCPRLTKLTFYSGISNDTKERIGLDKARITLLSDTASGKLLWENDFVFYEKDTDCRLLTYVGSNTQIALPTTCNGKEYVIAPYAFYKMTALFAVSIPVGVTDIGDNAFAGCTQLLTKQDGITYVDGWILGADKLPAKVDLPTATKGIAAGAFRDHTEIVAITLPAGLYHIGKNAFTGCLRLIEVKDLSSTLTITAGSEAHGGVARYAQNVYGTGGESRLYTDGDGFIFYEDMLITYTGQSLSDLALPESCKGSPYSIYQYAFWKNEALKHVTLSVSVTAIGQQAFADCTALESIHIPENGSLSLIGKQAFDGCGALTAITLPTALTAIDAAAFRDCRALATVSVADGCLLACIGAAAFTRCKAIIHFPLEALNSLITLDRSVFSYCYALEEVRLPSSLVTIGDSCFWGCYALSSLAVPQGSALAEVGYGAFGFCRSLERVDVGNIAAWCQIDFGDNTSNPLSNSATLYENGSPVYQLELPLSVTTIKKYAFYGARNLFSVAIPPTVTEVASTAFTDCPQLVEFFNPASRRLGDDNIANALIVHNADGIPSRLTFTESGVVFYRHNTTVLCVGYFGSDPILRLPKAPDDADYSIHKNAFYGNRTLVAAILPDGVTAIDKYAFYGCENLTSITLPFTLKSIAVDAFWDCDRLFEIVNLSTIDLKEDKNFYYWGGNVRVICQSAEGSTVSVTDDGFIFLMLNGKATLVGTRQRKGTLTLPASFAGGSYVIGAYALRALPCTTVIIPDGVTAIEAYAFFECSQLTTVVLPSTLTDVAPNAFGKCDLLRGEVVDGVIYLGNWVIGSEEGLTEATIREGVVGIAGGAFSRQKSLVTLSMPQSLRYICDKAFYACTPLRELSIPTAVELLSPTAFDECPNLTQTIDGVKYQLNAVIGCENNVTEVIVREGTVYISDHAFRDKKITRVVLPDSVRHIGEKAFAGCVSLQSIVISEQSALATIGSLAFEGCLSLHNVFIPAATTTISLDAFSSCRNIESITVAGGNATYRSSGNCLIKGSTVILGCFLSVIPDDGSITAIGDGAFKNCNGGHSVTLPEGIVTIGKSAFEGSSFMSSIPLSVEIIGERAFYDTDIKAILLGEGCRLQTIGVEAFASCLLLQTVTLPASLERLESFAFASCSKLYSLTLSEGIALTVIGDHAFEKTIIPTLTLPEGITHVGDYAFTDALLETLSLPASLLYIGNYAFEGNNNLSTLTFAPGSSLCEIGAYAFYYSKKLGTVTFPAALQKIGQYAFAESCVRPVFPTDSSLTAIEASAFAKGTLTDLCLPASLLTIGSSAFADCRQLTAVTFAEKAKLTAIESGAFNTCMALKQFAMPQKVTDIGSYAFSNCRALEAITLPTGLKTIDEYTFNCCYALTTLTFAQDCAPAAIGTRAFYDSGLASFTLPKSVEVIETEAFRGAELTSFVIPEGSLLERIGEYAFKSCIKLVRVTLENATSLKTISKQAFFECEALTAITLPVSLTSIGTEAFWDTELTSVVFKSPSGWSYTTKYGTYTLDGLDNTETAATKLTFEFGKYAWKK